jgi:hypothetical protein
VAPGQETSRIAGGAAVVALILFLRRKEHLPRGHEDHDGVADDFPLLGEVQEKLVGAEVVRLQDDPHAQDVVPVATRQSTDSIGIQI